MVIRIRCNDGHEFLVSKDVANMSAVLRGMLDELGDHLAHVVLPNVNGGTMAHVLDYCRKHMQINKVASNATATQRMGHTLMAICSREALFELTNAANYLDIEELRDVACDFIANMVDGKSTEEIRVLLNLTSDFTEEEELAIRNEKWVFDRSTHANTNLTMRRFHAKDNPM